MLERTASCVDCTTHMYHRDSTSTYPTSSPWYRLAENYFCTISNRVISRTRATFRGKCQMRWHMYVAFASARRCAVYVNVQFLYMYMTEHFNCTTRTLDTWKVIDTNIQRPTWVLERGFREAEFGSLAHGSCDWLTFESASKDQWRMTSFDSLGHESDGYFLTLPIGIIQNCSSTFNSSSARSLLRLLCSASVD